MKIVRRGALPVGGESGLLDVRDRALRGFGDRARGAARCAPEDVWPAFVERVLSFVDVERDPAAEVVIDAANGMAGAMLPPVLERLPIEAVALLLRARRHLPEPRAEPAAAREPRVHRREDARGGRRPRRRLRRRRRPLLLRRRHRRVRARRLRHRAARRVDPREGARREGDLRRARELGRARDDRARRRRRARQPRRPRVHQAPHAQGGRGLRRRGLGPLLLPRLLAGRLGRRAVPAHARAVSKKGRKLSEILAPYRERYFITGELNTPVADVPLKLQELKERYAAEGGVSHLDGVSVDADDWHFNVRPSNTEPLLRLNLEARSQELMEREARRGARRDPLVKAARARDRRSASSSRARSTRSPTSRASASGTRR